MDGEIYWVDKSSGKMRDWEFKVKQDIEMKKNFFLKNLNSLLIYDVIRAI